METQGRPDAAHPRPRRQPGRRHARSSACQDPSERFDPQRTLRRQNSLYLTHRHACCIRTSATPMLTIVADTCGRHDTLGGACAQESNTVRYALDKRYMHSCRDNFLRACAHDGRLGKRDIGANINFFMNVPVTPEGGLTFEDGISAPRQVRRAARRDGRARADLQLPAVEQPLQCLQPDAGRAAGLGLNARDCAAGCLPCARPVPGSA